MNYTPFQNNVFVSAMAGALAGIGVAERPITSTNASDYSSLATSAFAFAVEFDALWNSEVAEIANSYQIPAIQLACQGYWIDRYALPTDFTGVCRSILAAIVAGESFIEAQGYTPSAFDGGSHTIQTVSSAYIIQPGDEVLLLTGGVYSVTLPTPTAGRFLYIKDAAGTAFTENKTIVGGTIDGASDYVLNLNYASIHLTSDDTDWFILAAYSGSVV